MRARFSSVDWRRGLRVSGLVVLVLLVLPFVAYAFPPVVGASGSYLVVSDSMNDEPAPVIEAGDVVYVYDIPTDQVEEGDVITYRSEGKLVTTHRVVGVQQEGDTRYFETKGDANEEADPNLVPADRVVGTVELVVPQIGHVIVFASTSLGIVALVIIPTSLLLLSELASLVQASGSSGDAEPSASAEPTDEGSDFDWVKEND